MSAGEEEGQWPVIYSLASRTIAPLYVEAWSPAKIRVTGTIDLGISAAGALTLCLLPLFKLRDRSTRPLHNHQSAADVRATTHRKSSELVFLVWPTLSRSVVFGEPLSFLGRAVRVDGL
jgi:hypothetical protein